MVTNKGLFAPTNLLLSPKDPFVYLLELAHYGEINSSSWFKETRTKECHLPNHILMPYYNFIDSISVDKYGMLIFDAVLTCCLWINMKYHNRSSTWWVQRFVQDKKLFRDLKKYIRNAEVQDYHDMLS